MLYRFTTTLAFDQWKLLSFLPEIIWRRKEGTFLLQCSYWEDSMYIIVHVYSIGMTLQGLLRRRHCFKLYKILNYLSYSAVMHRLWTCCYGTCSRLISKKLLTISWRWCMLYYLVCILLFEEFVSGYSIKSHYLYPKSDAYSIIVYMMGLAWYPAWRKSVWYTLMRFRLIKNGVAHAYDVYTV